MTITSAPPVPPADTPPEGQRILPLVNGDHLTRDEFERRFDATPGLKRAELIQGIVRIPAPQHWQAAAAGAHLCGWLGFYRAHTRGTRCGAYPHLRLPGDNMPQPDAILLLPSHVGRADFDCGYVARGPELIAETSPDTEAKRRLYQTNGVREYLIWRVLDNAIDWFILRGTQYEPLAPGPDGVIRSEVLPGLWLAVPAMLAGDLAHVLTVLQQGIASPEHAAFVAALPPAG